MEGRFAGPFSSPEVGHAFCAQEVKRHVLRISSVSAVRGARNACVCDTSVARFMMPCIR